MQSLTIVLWWQLALAAPAAEPRRAAESPPAAARATPARPQAPVNEPGYEPVVAEYAQMTAAERKQYVEQLILGRLEPAAQLTLDDEALARQQGIDREILERLRAGRTISPQGLVKLLRKLDALEGAAVERLSRAYRVEVYSQFHSRRDEYQRRIDVWKRVAAAWEAGGKLPDEQRQLIAWLRRATDRLRADGAARLPPIPKFAERAPAPRVAGPGRVAMLPGGAAAEESPLQPAPSAIGRRSSAGQLPDLERAFPPLAHLPTPPVAPPAPGKPLARPSTDAPAAQPPAGQSLTDGPLARQRPQLHLALRPVERPVDPSGAPAARIADNTLEAQPGQIDLDELSVRIAGHNLALSRLAGRLHSQEPWTVSQLRAALVELEDLNSRRRDLFLYWDLIGDEHRALVGKLQSAAPSIALLGAKISLVHAAAGGGDQVDAGATGHLAEIDILSRRLAQLAVESQR